jgi:phosphatidylserine/phosphatidylglycerophosphate/cardiolipin synthase-like enzyme
MTNPALTVNFLEDGSQNADQIAGLLCDFFAQAGHTLDAAIYDFALTGPPADRVRQSLHALTENGVRVRLLYNVDFPFPVPVPPPPEPDSAFIASLGVMARPISGVPSLMHHKYAIVDAGSANASVWTGSTNWTNDSWTREENVIVKLRSAEISAQYSRNFEELWQSGKVELSGKYDLPWISLPDDLRLRLLFSPGQGPKMAHRIADRLAGAQRRIRLCSPVITAGPVLGTLAELAGHLNVDFKGVFDRTQMAEVAGQWKDDPHAAWKLPAWQTVSTQLPFASKLSTPYQSGSVHDYLHAKITVVDDTVFTGSYNLSHSGEENAENLLQFESPTLADRFAGFVENVYSRYAVPMSVAAK